MKILSVAPFAITGDAASWRVLNINRLLKEKGHDLCFLERGSGFSSLWISHLGHATKCMKKILHNDYDLVYGHTHLGALYCIWSRLRGIPLVFDMHGGLVEEFWFQVKTLQALLSLKKMLRLSIYKLIDWLDRRFVSGIVCVSRTMVRFLHDEKGVPLKKLFYVPNGVDTQFFKPVPLDLVEFLKAQAGLQGKFVVGYVGGMAEWQGVNQLVKAVELIKCPEIVVLIGGARQEGKRGKIIYLPRTDRKGVRQYYALCDVLALPRPSHIATELAAPTKFAEYCAMGKPILTTKVGDAGELTRTHNCGVVVESNEPRTLARAILDLMAKTKDELRLMGKNARTLSVSEFDWRVVANKLERALSNVVQERKK